MKEKAFTLKTRIDSFRYAFHGLSVLVFKEYNTRIHLIIMLLVITMGFIYGINATEWLFLVLVIGFVLAAEAFNSAIEHLADYTAPEFHNMIKRTKDLSAAAVLIAAIAASIVGFIIFYPKIF